MDQINGFPGFRRKLIDRKDVGHGVRRMLTCTVASVKDRLPDAS